MEPAFGRAPCSPNAAPGSSKNPTRPQLPIDIQTAFQRLLTARVLVVLVKN